MTKGSIEILSPIHIGNGNELQLTDFVINEEEKTAIIIDQDKFFNDIYEKGLDLMEIFANDKYKTEIKEEGRSTKYFSIDKYLKNERLNPKNFLKYLIPVSIDWAINRERKITIQEQIKNPVNPYIPGSSLKGAIRTALLWYIIHKDKELEDMTRKNIDFLLRQRGGDPKRAADYVERRIFGKDPTEDILKTLLIGDSDGIDFSNLELSEIRIIGNGISIPVYLESLKPSSVLKFIWKIDTNILSYHIFNENVAKPYIIKDNIIKACNSFSSALIEKDLTFSYPEKSKAFLQELKNKISHLSPNEFILKLGWGSGWYATTLGLILEKFNNFYNLRKKFRLGQRPRSRTLSESFPGTRRINVDGLPLGWIKVLLR